MDTYKYVLQKNTHNVLIKYKYRTKNMHERNLSVAILATCRVSRNNLKSLILLHGL